MVLWRGDQIPLYWTASLNFIFRSLRMDRRYHVVAPKYPVSLVREKTLWHPDRI